MRIWLAVSVLIATSAYGQDLPQYLRAAGASASLAAEGDCSDGIAYDDGTFENGYGFNSSSLFGRLAMRFDLPSSANKVKAICVCWRTLGGTNIDYSADLFAVNGAGAPGDEIASLDGGTVTGLTGTGKWFRVENPEDLVVGSSVYAGVFWSPFAYPNRYLCSDENGPGGQPAYGGTSIFPPSALITTAFPSYRALGIRLVVEPATCLPGATALCLNSGRFRVEATYQTSSGQTGDAQVVKLTDQSGYLWFFNSENVEAVVKVLDACALNNKFWVFAGGLTNVQVNLTVTDTETGNAKTYTNPQGKAFLPIQDTAALPCN